LREESWRGEFLGGEFLELRWLAREDAAVIADDSRLLSGEVVAG
jgi:hypothetical protein